MQPQKPISSIPGQSLPGSAPPPSSSSSSTSSNTLSIIASDALKDPQSSLGKRSLNNILKQVDMIKTYKGILDISAPQIVKTNSINQDEIAIKITFNNSNIPLLFIVNSDKIKNLFNNINYKYSSEGPSRDCYELKFQEGEIVRTCYLRSTSSMKTFLNGFISEFQLSTDACIEYLKDGTITDHVDQYSADNIEHSQNSNLFRSNQTPPPLSNPQMRVTQAVNPLLSSSSTSSSNVNVPKTVATISALVATSSSSTVQPKAPFDLPLDVLLATLAADEPGATKESILKKLAFYQFEEMPAEYLVLATMAAKKQDATVQSVINEMLKEVSDDHHVICFAAAAIAARKPLASKKSINAFMLQTLADLYAPNPLRSSISALILKAIKAAQEPGATEKSITNALKADLKGRTFDHIAQLCVKIALVAADPKTTIHTLQEILQVRPDTMAFTSAVRAALLPSATEDTVAAAAFFHLLTPIAASGAAAEPLPEIIVPLPSPDEEKLKLYKHEKWLVKHWDNKPELWHQSTSLEEVFQTMKNITKSGSDDIQGLISSLCEGIDQGSLVPDYQLSFWLFHLRNYAAQDCVIQKNLDLISTLLRLSMEKMSIPNKGEVARFAGLIDSREGEAFRNEIFPYLYQLSAWSKERSYELPEGHSGWLSVQEILRNEITVANELIQSGPSGMLMSHYEELPYFIPFFQDSGLEERFISACLMHISHCNSRLKELEEGYEVRLPKYYFSTSDPSNLIPSGFLNKKRIYSSDSPNHSNEILISTRLPATGPFLAFDEHVLWRDAADINQLSLDDHGSYQIELRKSIPLCLEGDYEGDSLRRTPVALITPVIFEQKHIAESVGAAKIPVMGVFQALIEQYCYDQVSPFLCPKHWPL